MNLCYGDNKFTCCCRWRTVYHNSWLIHNCIHVEIGEVQKPQINWIYIYSKCIEYCIKWCVWGEPGLVRLPKPRTRATSDDKFSLEVLQNTFLSQCYLFYSIVSNGMAFEWFIDILSMCHINHVQNVLEINFGPLVLYHYSTIHISTHFWSIV